MWGHLSLFLFNAFPHSLPCYILSTIEAKASSVNNTEAIMISICVRVVPNNNCEDTLKDKRKRKKAGPGIIL